MIDTNNDKQLAARVVGGDRRAVETFFDLYYPRVYRFCMARMRDETASEDITQETMLAALKGLHTYRGDAALFSWLCLLCRHEVSAWLVKNRKHHHQHVELQDSDELQRALEALESGGEPESRFALNQLIHSVLDHLPDDHSKVLELKYIEGRSVGEIADRMSTGKTAVQSMLARARKSFQTVFTQISAEVAPTGAQEGRSHE